MDFRKINPNVVPPLFSDDTTWSIDFTTAPSTTTTENIVRPTQLGALLRDCCSIDAQPQNYNNNENQPPPGSSAVTPATVNYKTLTWSHIIEPYEDDLSTPIVTSVRSTTSNDTLRSLGTLQPHPQPQQLGVVMPCLMEINGNLFQSRLNGRACHGEDHQAVIVAGVSRSAGFCKVIQRPKPSNTNNNNNAARACTIVPQQRHTDDAHHPPRPAAVSMHGATAIMLTQPRKDAPDAPPAPATAPITAFRSKPALSPPVPAVPAPSSNLRVATAVAVTTPSPFTTAPKKSRQQSYIPLPLTKKKTTPPSLDRGINQEQPEESTAATGDVVSMLRDSLFKFKSSNSFESSTPGSTRGGTRYTSGETRYTNVIEAHAKSGSPAKAEEGLRRMILEYLSGRNTFEPNARCFTRVLVAWRKSQLAEAPERCEALLRTMFDYSDSLMLSNCQPDTFSINVTMHCWVDSERPDASQHVGPLFREMKDRFLGGEETLCPDHVSYSMTLNTYAKEMKTEKAEAMLDEMVQDFLDGNAAAEPRLQNFNTIMNMYARSNTSEATERAARVVSRFRGLANKGILQIELDELRLDIRERFRRQIVRSSTPKATSILKNHQY